MKVSGSMKAQNAVLKAGVGSLVAFLCACGSSSSNNLTMQMKVSGVTGLTSSLDISKEAGFSGLLDGLKGLYESRNENLAASDWAVNTAAQLEALEYFITSIQICQSLTETGSGYTNPTGCSTIYTNSAFANNYDSYLTTQAMAETNANAYTNFMSSTDVAKLTTTASLSAGTYRYGIINYQRPFRVKGKITVGASTLQTCTNGTMSSTGTGLSTQETITVSNMTSCTYGKQAFMLTSGGNLFRFGSTGLVIPDSTTQYSVDLAFNPDSFVAGTTDTASAGLTSTSYTSSANQSMQFGFIDISPVVRTSSQKSYKMTFTSADVDATSISARFRFRLELYFAGSSTSDASTATIQGINLRTIKPLTGTGKYYGASGSATVNTRTSTTGTSGEIDLLNYSGSAVFTGLNRSIAVGATDSVTVSLGTLGIIGGSDTAVTFTLTSIDEVK